MSRAKDLLDIQFAEQDIVEEIAIMAGILTRCEMCDDVVWLDDSEDNYRLAYKIANKMVTEGEIGPKYFNGNRRTLTDAIKEVQGSLYCHCEIVMME
ncbi:MAG: hypothetical protein GF349_04005 [Candidatus Magasanikbacteria bacterium]|nr:hypothetical protein [Candidatus Magasanikbacteria bacterium]